MGYNAELEGFEIYSAIGGQVSFGKDRISAKVGRGAGVKLSYINILVKSSISLTDSESDILNEKSGVVFETWKVINSFYDKDNNKWNAQVGTYNRQCKLINSEIIIVSENIKDDKGNNSSSNIWYSPEYEKDAKKAEKSN